MGGPEQDPWWRGLLPRRRRGPPIEIRLPDGSAVPASFAAAVLGQRERAGTEARRRGEGTFQPPPGRLGRAALGAGLRPSVDTIGPRAEAVLRVWLKEVDRELPEVVAALETGDRAAFLLRGWITPAGFPATRLEAPGGSVVSFRPLRRAGLQGLPASQGGGGGGTALVAASVTGPLVPRLRPSPAVAADGLLVPVGFTEEGCLYLPLVGPPLAVGGERSNELLSALAIYAQLRIGPEACRVLATGGLLAMLDAVVATEALGSGGPGEAAAAMRMLGLQRRREIVDHREAALSLGPAPTPPILLVFVDEETAQRLEGPLPGGGDLGIGAIVAGDSHAPRKAWVSAEGVLLTLAPELPPFRVEPAVLSVDAMAEAALVLRRSVAPSPAGGSPRKDYAPATGIQVASAPRSPEDRDEIAGRSLEDKDDAAVRVLCLGGVRVFLGGKPVEGGWRKKALELLALLAAHPEGLTRERVLDALWPEDPPAKTGDRLRQCLRQLRQRLGAGGAMTIADWVDDRLRLDQVGVWSDVGAFQAALKRARAAGGGEKVTVLRRAVELYAGPFCEGHPFDWALPTQERLRRDFLESSADLAGALVESGDPDAALRILDRATEEDPLAEHIYRMAIEIEIGRGNAAAAKARFERLRHLLMEELGVEPSDETRASYQAEELDE